ncbi:molybdopterin molybdotransferase MoeA [Clostridium sp. NSJ-145]|uniref:molybdopterin molybdotransferase MoeA n=1 Tax=Clostridium sp. NSJ-145 TaxID=2897777 RepID=UPI001E3813C1|nr:gephyrin-like molybdotransferase Glp [Clostridium sp. NSJ-145]MCD2500710.1 molybdopterin molybdotransferase MoeA [Clostridium sp. NSJ-145]
MKSFISLEEAIEILSENVRFIGIEEVSLLSGIGRILSEDIFSKIDNPPFNKSAMDGYAVISIDTEEGKKSLKVIDQVFAGDVCKSEVKQGTAIKIMTGAPIPIGANAVIKQEDVTFKDGFIEVNKVLKAEENICLKGEDIKEGTLLVKKGKKLDYADIGILASSGIRTVNVYKKPRVAFISTGDEVLDLDEALIGGKIYNSNKYTILGRLAELGYEVTYVDHENDSFIGIGNKIKEASRGADFIITTGGASVGEKDLIKEAIDYINGEKLFWKINIKPGSAMLCSKYDKKIIVSLSGNPTAALTTFELIAKTTLEKLSGKENIEISREKAILTNEFKKKSPNRRFLRGTVTSDVNGQKVEITQVKSGNGILSSTLNSNCLIELEAGNEGVNKGDIVTIIKF